MSLKKSRYYHFLHILFFTFSSAALTFAISTDLPTSSVSSNLQPTSTEGIQDSSTTPRPNESASVIRQQRKDFYYEKRSSDGIYQLQPSLNFKKFNKTRKSSSKNGEIYFPQQDPIKFSAKIPKNSNPSPSSSIDNNEDNSKTESKRSEGSYAEGSNTGAFYDDYARPIPPSYEDNVKDVYPHGNHEDLENTINDHYTTKNLVGKYEKFPEIPSEEHHSEHHHHHHHHKHNLKEPFLYPHVKHYSHEDVHFGQTIGRALKILIPSALFLTGVSALFPNRVIVPTTEDDVKNGNHHKIFKRSIPFDPNMEEFINSKYLEGQNQASQQKRVIEKRSTIMHMYPPVESSILELPLQEFDQTQQQQTQRRSNINRRGKKRQIILHQSPPQPYQSYYTPVVNNAPYYQPPLILNEYVPMSYEAIPAETIPTFTQQNPNPINVGPKSRQTTPPPLPPVVRPSKAAKTNTNRRTPSSARKENTDRNTSLNKAASSTISTKTIRPAQVKEAISTQKELTHNIKEQVEEKSIKKQQNSISNSKISPIASANSIVQQILSPTLEKDKNAKSYDLSPNSPVVGLINSYVIHDNESPSCQKRALCELAMKGSKSSGTKFEKFLFTLANLVPDSLSGIYDLEDIFGAVRNKECKTFRCRNPNMDLQIIENENKSEK